MASATTNIAAAAITTVARTSPSSACAWLPNQAYEHHAHHSSASSTRPRRAPTTVGSSAIRAVT